jgi:hypothetical protein
MENKPILCPYCFKQLYLSDLIPHLIHDHGYPSYAKEEYVKERLANAGHKDIFENEK